jgi:formylglycine-generating enzyme required for sulfatase activity
LCVHGSLDKRGYSDYPPFYFGETITTDYVNYDGNYPYGKAPKGEYRQQTTPVGQFPPNAFGICDLHGNVWEWCADGWHDSYADKPDDLNNNGSTIWLSSDISTHILRGGSWFNASWFCRSANRYWDDADYRYYYYGFRLVLSFFP